jgi:hypothetical protein
MAIFFTQRMAIWEYPIIFGVPAIAILIGNYASISSQTIDKEYWNSYIVRATYYEDWNEYIHQTCTREECSGSGENRVCHTETYDCSYVDYHPEYWEVEDNLGSIHYIRSDHFEYLCKSWKMRQFRDMHRGYYSNDGDAYDTQWDTKFETLAPICIEHTYENKVQCSKSVFNFQKVDSASKATYKLFDYPPNQDAFKYNPILGIKYIKASWQLQKYNALYGKTKQIHMLLLVFNNQPYEAAVMQESYWKGGNKNEFILCVGTKGNKITWTKVISWTEAEELKVRVARQVKQMDSLNVMAVVEYMGKEVPKEFVRKHFRDFNYLTVEPTNTAIIICLILTVLTTIGGVVFSLANPYNLNNTSFKSRF